MPQTVILAVGLDSSLMANQGAAWQSARYFVFTAVSISEAIAHIRRHDFDLALLGRSLSAESRERLAFLIRSSDARIPVVCLADSSSDCDSFADATIRSKPIELLEDIEEIMAKRPKSPAPDDAMPRIAV